MSTRAQPTDEWDYLRSEADDDRPGDDRGPEDLALHEGTDGVRPAQDPGRSDESAEVDEDDGPTEDHYPDEEPERSTWRAEEEHEPDLEEILESQHYAFADESDDEDGDEPPPAAEG